MATRDIHFVGSIGLADAQTVFRTLAETVGERAKRYPDGETGVRHYWIIWQGEVFATHPDFRLATMRPPLTDTANPTPVYALREGVAFDTLHFEPLGYAREALASYEIFKRLRVDGVIPDGVRFQVSLPTPAAVITTFVEFEQRAGVEPAYERAMAGEVDAILKAIPHTDLAIQWDIAHEVIAQDGALPLHYTDVLDGTTARVVRQLQTIPESAEVRTHILTEHSS